MSDTTRKVEYFTASVPNKSGEGVRALKALRDANVNLLAFSGFPRAGRAQIDFIPEDSAALKAAAKKAKLKLSSKKTGFLTQGSDRVGALLDMLDRLAAAKINVTALDAVTVGEGRYGAIFWVKPKDVAKTAKLLGVSSGKQASSAAYPVL
ncbi:MAG TPA: hypothetical protein VHE58_06875 [Burkholderiales bacterium]|nr:hypothetical protein [Burkholderiales bacterium]